MADGAKRDFDTAPWQRAVTKVLAFGEERQVRIIGLIGDRPGVGVSLLCRELAAAYARNGMNALLVDASRVATTAEGESAVVDLLALAKPIGPGRSYVDLAEHGAILPSDRRKVQQIFQNAAASGVTIVVDLPAIDTGPGKDAHIAGLVGCACQLAYLVCMSGVIKKIELRDYMEQCKINQIPIEGIIINDWKQPVAWLATDW